MGGDSRYSTMLSTTLPTLGGINFHKEALKQIQNAKGKKKWTAKIFLPYSRCGGSGFKPPPSRCFHRQGTLLHFVSLHPAVGDDELWVPVTYCLGVNMRRTSIPSRRGLAILLGMLHAVKGNRDKLRPFGPLARVRLYLHHLITMNSSRWTQIIINKQDLFKTYNLRI